jgi:hypothetical protein
MYRVYVLDGGDDVMYSVIADSLSLCFQAIALRTDLLPGNKAQSYRIEAPATHLNRG